MSIKLNIKGFEELLDSIQKAGGSIDKAADSAIRASAQIMQSELKNEMQKSNVDGALINRMPPPRIERSGNRVSAKVGYAKGNYDPKNPSDAYKVVFVNYGTPRRTAHGKIEGKTVKMGFIERAKRKARPKIKKQQELVFKKILARLKK